jgi:hypothetical protein
MAPSEHGKAFLVSVFVVVLTQTTTTVHGLKRQLPTWQNKTCSSLGTAVTCTGWPKWDEVPVSTTSLSISGATEVTELSLADRPGQPLINLTTLALTNNGLGSIDEGWFSGSIFPALTDVILDQNELEPNATQRMFARVSTELRLLSLTQAFSNTSSTVQNLTNVLSDVVGAKLEILKLDSNNIGLLPPFPSGFTFPELKNFTLHNSGLIGIPSGIFQVIQTIVITSYKGCWIYKDFGDTGFLLCILSAHQR